MPIPTTRTKEKAEIRINRDKCNGCGLCVNVCKDFSVILEKGKVKLSNNPAFGCIGCGHCMAVCPEEAIHIFGRELSPAVLFNLPAREQAADYKQLLALFKRRRSIREFHDREVEPDVVEKILEAARTSPMGIPPSDVNVLVLVNKKVVRNFAADFCNYLTDMKWFVSNWFLAFMRPFWGKANDEMFKDFVKPLFKIYTENMNAGINLVTYDAPLAMYFYGSPYADPADPVVAATTAMYAAESSGLGTCMIGGVHPLIQNGKRARKLREKYNIKYTSREG